MNTMSKSTLASRTAVAVALALAGLTADAQQRAPAAPAAPAQQDAARAELAKPLQAAQGLLQEGKYAEALAKLREAEAVGNLSPYETYHVERLRAAAAMGAKDVPLTIKSLEAAMATGRGTPEDTQTNLRALADLNFRQKDYPRAIAAAQRYLQEGGQDPAMRSLLTNALYLQGDYAAAAKALQAEVQAEEAAGRVPSEQRLRMLASAQAKVNDEDGYAQTLERLAARYPKPELWADLINRVQAAPNFGDHLRLDAYRLRMATGTLKQGPEYVEMAQLALQAGYPAEAAKVIDEGYARGVLGTGGQAGRHAQLRDQARKLAAADAQSLSQASAQTAKNGDVMVTMGYALVSAGQVDKGIALMEQGIAKGGLKRPDEARLRLAAALYQAGRKDAAVQALKPVQGQDGAAGLARVWTLLAQSPAPQATARQ